MSNGEICKYKGNLVGCRFEGYGTYESSFGRYVGNFIDGQFHGEGTLFVKGGYYKGDFEKGKFVEGKFVSTDGLECEELSEWQYCTQDDPRFKVEIDEGVDIDGPYLYTTAYPDPHPIPYGCYDMEIGYYDPNECAIFSYTTKDKIRNVEKEEEKEWIINNCRVGVSMDDIIQEE